MEQKVACVVENSVKLLKVLIVGLVEFVEAFLVLEPVFDRVERMVELFPCVKTSFEHRFHAFQLDVQTPQSFFVLFESGKVRLVFD